MNVWKKLAGLALALAVVMSLTVSAWAATGTLLTGSTEATAEEIANGIDGTSFTVTMDNSTAQGNGVLRLPEDVTFTISGGGVTFKTDQTSDKVTLADGTTATVSFAGSTNGAQESVPVDLTFTASEGSIQTPTDGLGRYYQVTITPSQGSSNGTPYYLYVFVKYDGTNYTPYAAIMASERDWGNSLTKQNTFALQSSVQTGSVKVQKTVTGAGDVSEQFTFNVHITLPDNFNPTAFSFPYSTSNTGAASFVGTTSLAGTAFTLVESSTTQYEKTLTGTLTHGAWFQIDGLPDGTLVEVKETPSTITTYAISSAIEGMTSTMVVGGPNGFTENGTHYYTRGYVQAGVNGVITYTNYLESISPTGVVLRFAPYLAMLGAGLTTMVIAPRRKEDEV